MNAKVKLFLFFIGLGGFVPSAFGLQPMYTIDLSGSWRFALDQSDVGISGKWYNQTLKDRIQLPGILQSQGCGDPISKHTPWVLSLYDHQWYLRQEYKSYAEGEVKVPFLSQPPRHYLGTAWYQRDIEIPPDWEGRRIGLILERARWKTIVWIDNQQIGTQDSLVAPHYFEFGALSPGRHQLTICADNRMQMNYRPDAHSVSDSLGSTWNGIVGRIELFSTTPVWIDQIRAFPNIAEKSVRLDIHIGNQTGRKGQGMLEAGDVRLPVLWNADGGRAEMKVNLGQDARLWDEFSPVVHRLTVVLKGPNADDRREVKFGLRQISADGSDLLINGRKSHFRGTHSGGDFPLTGYPATGLDYWRGLLTTCKTWGLNHIRFHSFCPPEAAFEAADELGIYLQPEAGMWNDISPNTPMEKRMYEESDRMLRAFGNHPSFVLFSPSNEPKGRWKESLTRWVEHYRTEDPRRLYTTGTGWPLIEQPGHVEGADFLATHRIGPRPMRGERAWFGDNYLSSMQGVDVPIIVHELGQWCAYPSSDIIQKFTGYLRPDNYEIFRDSAAAAGLLDKNKQFAMASGKFQLACYKEEIEANLRTPGLVGFQLLDLHDYLGQGTALVGVLDAFWEEKGYVTAEQWRRFCGPTVPLAILKKRIFTTEDILDSQVLIAHYGPAPLDKAEVYWKILDTNNNLLQGGRWTVDIIGLGSALPLGRIQTDLSALKAPAMYKLAVGLSGTAVENDWNFWLYPSQASEKPHPNIRIARLYEEAMDLLSQGQKVLWIPLYNQLAWDCPPIGGLPIFWNRQMGPKWDRFLGLVCDPTHPALGSFASDYYYDRQWTDVLSPACRAINLNNLPGRLEPIVQIIDDWNRNDKLGAIFECRVGEGKLLVCAADLETKLDQRPAARQLRQSLLQYMESEKFEPKTAVSAEQLHGLLFDNQMMKKLGAEPFAENQTGPNAAANAIDGNPNTYWLSGRQGREKGHPHDLTIRFAERIAFTGLLWMNRQDHREHEGDICEYEIAVSEDGKTWTEAARGRMESTFRLQRLELGRTIAAQYLKIRAVSGFGPDTTASVAEIAVILAEDAPGGPTGENTEVYKNVQTATEEIFEGTAAPD